MPNSGEICLRCLNIADASPEEASGRRTQALAIAQDLQATGRLAPVDAWIPEELARRLADLADDRG